MEANDTHSPTSTTSQPHSPADSHSQASPTSQPAAASRPVASAPWDDDDWGQPPVPQQKPPAPAQPESPKSPKEDAAGEAAEEHQQQPDAPSLFTQSERSAVPPSAGPAAPTAFVHSPDAAPKPEEKPAAPAPAPSAKKPSPAANPSSAALEALKKQVNNRTAQQDAETKAKEEKILAAAKEFIKNEQQKREQQVKAVKADHQKSQQEGEKKIDEYKKSGAVWSAVGMLVDLQKPNPYSKNTERMRAVLTTLNKEGAPKVPHA